MAIERRNFRKPAGYADESYKSNKEGDLYGIYIGIVRRTTDLQRTGRLLVFIPEISPRDDETNWVSVSYAPPYYGTTNPNYTTSEKKEKVKVNTYEQTKHSYGMWFVPPDPGVRVLIAFANGDINRGFWFACIPDSHSHHEVPSIGSAKVTNGEASTGQLSGADLPDQVPVAEFSESEEFDKSLDWAANPRPVHKAQFDVLREQGLEFDYYRGAVRSSSQRETPSATFGISTPGRPLDETGKETQDAYLNPKLRKGGHTFVMDDGDLRGNDNFFRIRTGGGHQILMHDTGKFIYITNSTGTAWIEMNNKGDIEIFAEGYFNLRSAQSINLHADQKINMYAGTGINIATEQEFKTDSKVLYCKTSGVIHLSADDNLLLKTGSSLNFEASSGSSMKSSGQLSLEGSIINLNSGGTTSVEKLVGIQRKPFPNSVKTGNRYKTIQNRITSIVDRVPIHEPDPGHLILATQAGTGSTTAAATEVGRDSGRVPSTSAPATGFAKQTGTGFDATKTTAAGKVKSRNLKAYIDKQPDPTGGVGTLTKDETKALMAGIGVSESNHDYTAVNQYGYTGKYQFGSYALADNGYIKPDYARKYGNKAMDIPEAWTGKDGVKSRNDFIGSPDVQEKVMQSNLQLNYDRMVRSGAIRKDDSPETVAGMLQTSHLLGAGGARKWRETGQGADANNTTGKVYFDKGKYAIQTLTKDGVIVS